MAQDESDHLLYKFSYAENTKPTIVKGRPKYYRGAPTDGTKPWMLDDLSKDRGGPTGLGNEPLRFASHEEAVKRLDRFINEGNIHLSWKAGMTVVQAYGGLRLTRIEAESLRVVLCKLKANNYWRFDTTPPSTGRGGDQLLSVIAQLEATRRQHVRTIRLPEGFYVLYFTLDELGEMNFFHDKAGDLILACEYKIRVIQEALSKVVN